jgi:hypothetical protein
LCLISKEKKEKKEKKEEPRQRDKKHRSTKKTSADINTNIVDASAQILHNPSEEPVLGV